MKLVNSDLITDLLHRAESSPRQRSHHNIHEHLNDIVQKLIVAATPNSYFRPHRHSDKSECAFVLRGRFAVFQYDDSGNITECKIIGENTDNLGLEIPPNTWHSWLALDAENVFFETKEGPYNPETAAEFAPWAPAEDTDGVESYMQKLREAI